MIRPTLLTALGVAAVLLLTTACFETSIDESATERRTIKVSGSGEVQAEPDIAEISAGVEVLGDTVAEARAEAAEAAASVIAALRAGGVEGRDIRTTQFSIHASYDYSGEVPFINGYAVFNAIEFTLRDIERAGDLIDAVIAAGGDAVQFSGISFALEDSIGLARTARELAVDDARAKAEQLAELTDVQLGELLSIVEASLSAPFVVAEYAVADRAFASPSPIEPGIAAVRVTVDVIWAIE